MPLRTSAERRLHAAIFDFDGLIADTETLHFESWQIEAQRVGIPLGEAAFGRIVGGDLTEAQAVELLLGRQHAPDAAAIAGRARQYRDSRRLSVRCLPGVRELIDQAHEAGLRVGLASSSPRDRVIEPLRRMGLLSQFHEVRCGDEVAQPKPAPDVYLAVIDALGVRAQDAVAFEDSGPGADAAMAAGLRCIAVPGPVTAHHDFSGCAATLASLADVTVSDVVAILGMRTV